LLTKQQLEQTLGPAGSPLDGGRPDGRADHPAANANDGSGNEIDVVGDGSQIDDSEQVHFCIFRLISDSVVNEAFERGNRPAEREPEEERANEEAHESSHQNLEVRHGFFGELLCVPATPHRTVSGICQKVVEPQN